MQAVKRLYLPETGMDGQLHSKDGGVSAGRAATEGVFSLLLLAAFFLAMWDLMPGVSCLIGGMGVGAAVLLLLTLTRGKEKMASAVNTALYLLTLVVFLVFILYVAQGFLLTVSRIFSLMNSRFGTEYAELIVDGRAGLGAVLFWCLLSVPLSVFLLSAVRKRAVGRLFLLLFAALLFACLLGRTLLVGKAILIAAALLCCMLYAAAPNRKCGVMFWCSAAALLVLACALVLASGAYQGSGTLTRFRESIAKAYEKLRYGEDTLPQGALDEAQGLLDGEEETLRVTMNVPQELYLKGYVGAVYTGTSWDTVSLDAYQGDNAGILRWLSQNGLVPQTQYAKMDDLARQSAGTVSSVEVENTGAYRKYVYLPESVKDWDAPHSGLHKDWQVESSRFFGAKTYSFTVVDNAQTADEAMAEDWMQSPANEAQQTYLQAESVYHAFAEEQYTALDEEMRTLLEETFFSGADKDVSEMDLREVTAQIRRVLRTVATYVEKPSQLPADEDDYVRWFLTEERKGNAVAFASAAVLAYRAAGYPARYAEGYRISEETAQALTDEGEHTAVLHNSDAHAWVEIYVSGSGWLPVEVVPGMYTEIYTDQIVEGQSSYQVNPSGEDDTYQADDGGEQGGGSYAEDDEQTKPLTLARIFVMLLLAAYLLFILFVILEAVRAVRIAYRKRHETEAFSTETYIRRLRMLLHMGGVRGELDKPQALADQVAVCFGKDYVKDYRRVVSLLEKVRFGGKTLQAHEIHTLECFADKLQKKLGKRKLDKLALRYVYAL